MIRPLPVKPVNLARRALLAGAAAVPLANAGGEAASATDPASPPTSLPDVGPGRKFARDGQVQRWPGCTLIAHIPRPGPAFDALCEVRDLMRTTPAIRTKLSWLPEQSYHATICDLLNISHRGQPGSWPAAVPRDATLDAACGHIAAVLRDLDLGMTPPLRLVVDPELMTSFRWGRNTNRLRTAVPWRPIDDQEAQRLASLRSRVYDAIGLHHPDERAYAFHTTLAYPVQPLAPSEVADYGERFVRAMRHLRAEVPVLELDAPEFCVFDSMFFFETQFRLRRRI